MPFSTLLLCGDTWCPICHRGHSFDFTKGEIKIAGVADTTSSGPDPTAVACSPVCAAAVLMVPCHEIALLCMAKPKHRLGSVNRLNSVCGGNSQTKFTY